MISRQPSVAVRAPNKETETAHGGIFREFNRGFRLVGEAEIPANSAARMRHIAGMVDQTLFEHLNIELLKDQQMIGAIAN